MQGSIKDRKMAQLSVRLPPNDEWNRSEATFIDQLRFLHV
jgi:hypothetical protein